MPLHRNDDLRVVTLFGRKYFWHWNGRYELKPVIKSGPVRKEIGS